MLLVLTLAGGGAFAQNEPAGLKAQPAEASPAPEMSANKGMRLGNGDLVEVQVFGVPELTTKTRITGSGDLILPLIGRTQVEGLTLDGAQALLEKRLVEGNFLKNPSVTLTILEFTTQGISVMGEVVKPGIYPLMGTRRLFDAISAAGGTTQKAGRLITITRRDDPLNPLHVSMPDDQARAIESNVEIYPGDTIMVTRAGIVYVVGEVTKPGGYIMENNGNLTVLQAIALAQGITKSARLDKARLIRKTPEGMKEMEIDLKGILTAKVQDQALLSDDIVFVPSSPGKNAARKTLETLMQTLTGVAVYTTVR